METKMSMIVFEIEWMEVAFLIRMFLEIFGQ